VKYWLDTEFIDRPGVLDLISVGMVAEDGREFYMESSEVDWSRASRWTLGTVKPLLEGPALPCERIGDALRLFTESDHEPVFWGYYPAFDWVAFVGLFGGLNDLPFHYPQMCLDIRQWAMAMGDPDLPVQTGVRHHALYDARWTKLAWTALKDIDPMGAERHTRRAGELAADLPRL
jgi:hypothetical protein